MNEAQWLVEQISAAKDIAHHHLCVDCQQERGEEPVVVVQDLPEGGCRVTIVVLCKGCMDKNEIS
jgi:hypothetical protein